MLKLKPICYLNLIFGASAALVAAQGGSEVLPEPALSVGSRFPTESTCYPVAQPIVSGELINNDEHWRQVVSASIAKRGCALCGHKPYALNFKREYPSVTSDRFVSVMQTHVVAKHCSDDYGLKHSYYCGHSGCEAVNAGKDSLRGHFRSRHKGVPAPVLTYQEKYGVAGASAISRPAAATSAVLTTKPSAAGGSRLAVESLRLPLKFVQPTILRRHGSSAIVSSASGSGGRLPAPAPTATAVVSTAARGANLAVPVLTAASASAAEIILPAEFRLGQEGVAKLNLESVYESSVNEEITNIERRAIASCKCFCALPDAETKALITAAVEQQIAERTAVQKRARDNTSGYPVPSIYEDATPVPALLPRPAQLRRIEVPVHIIAGAADQADLAPITDGEIDSWFK